MALSADRISTLRSGAAIDCDPNRFLAWTFTCASPDGSLDFRQ
jgi:hypothetical protein